MKKFALLFLIAATAFTACKKDNNEPDPSQTGKLRVELEHVFGSNGLALNSASYYTTANGQSVKLSMFKYYISNIKLTKNDGSVWAQPESYYLYDVSDPNQLVITGIPEGDYKAIEFMIGVDSTRNVSGAQTGALDPVNDMFWSWNSGYIFLKAEGESPDAGGGMFSFHVGGFSGADKAQRTVSLTFNGDEAIVREDLTPEVHLSVDVANFFNGTPNLDLATLSMIHMPGPDAAAIADRYVEMFEYEHVHN